MEVNEESEEEEEDEEEGEEGGDWDDDSQEEEGGHNLSGGLSKNQNSCNLVHFLYIICVLLCALFSADQLSLVWRNLTKVISILNWRSRD